jgi:urease accessory protein
MTSRRLVFPIAAATLLALVPSSAPVHAHVQTGEASGFLTGVGHPMSGLDHVVAMIAVGLWGAQLGAPALWLLPVTFP